MKLAKQIIQKSKQANAWSLGNQVLYELCITYYLHKNEKAIIAKIWLIGRAYAAAIERRKQKKDLNDDFYINIVAPRIKHSKLDDYLSEIKHHNDITNDNLTLVLQTHHYLMTIFHKLTGLEKRSLAAKYLHFHLPHLFYIYDSRAASALNGFTPKLKRREVEKIKSKHIDKTYETFVLKCLALRAEIKNSYKAELSPRQRNFKPQHTKCVLTIVPPHVAVMKWRNTPLEPNARQQPPATDTNSYNIFKHDATSRDRIERCKGCHKKILPGGCAAGSERVEIFL